jgi:hypothetical protein
VEKNMNDSKIAAGPFKGIGPGAAEMRPLLDRNRQPVIRDGKTVEVWSMHAKTPHALDVFKPLEGWGIVVNATPGPFEIPDPRTPQADAPTGQAMQPTMIFTAELINPEGRVLANASVLCIINSTFSWTDGISFARSKLYVALGLMMPNDPGEEPPATETPSGKSTAPVAGVAAISAPIRQDKLPAAAQAVIEQVVGASAPVDAPAVDATQVEATPASAATYTPREVSADVVSIKPVATNAAANAANPALNKNLLRQAEHRAKLQRTEVPLFANDDEIRAFCKNLLKKVG